MPDDVDLRTGSVAWVDFSPTRGSEQAGHRPAVVVSSNAYLAVVPNVVIAVPVTTTDRGYPHHIRLRGETGLGAASFAMTEQPRAIDRRRITSVSGRVDRDTMAAVWLCMTRFLDLG